MGCVRVVLSCGYGRHHGALRRGHCRVRVDLWCGPDRRTLVAVVVQAQVFVLLTSPLCLLLLLLPVTVVVVVVVMVVVVVPPLLFYSIEPRLLLLLLQLAARP